MLATALHLTPRYATLLQDAVEDFLPFVGPGEGKLHEEMAAVLAVLVEASHYYTRPSPNEVEGKPVLVDLADTVDLCWGTLVQAVEEWAEATHGQDWKQTEPKGSADFAALVRLLNAAEGQS